MQVPLRITLRRIPPSTMLDARIREQVSKLGRFNSRIIGYHVVVEEQARHKQQGRLFNVRIALQVPWHDIIINRDHDEDVYVALHAAFANLTSCLEDASRRVRRRVKKHRTPRVGDAAPPVP